MVHRRAHKRPAEGAGGTPNAANLAADGRHEITLRRHAVEACASECWQARRRSTAKNYGLKPRVDRAGWMWARLGMHSASGQPYERRSRDRSGERVVSPAKPRATETVRPGGAGPGTRPHDRVGLPDASALAAEQEGETAAGEVQIAPMSRPRRAPASPITSFRIAELDPTSSPTCSDGSAVKSAWAAPDPDCTRPDPGQTRRARGERITRTGQPFTFGQAPAGQITGESRPDPVSGRPDLVTRSSRTVGRRLDPPGRARPKSRGVRSGRQLRDSQGRFGMPLLPHMPVVPEDASALERWSSLSSARPGERAPGPASTRPGTGRGMQWRPPPVRIARLEACSAAPASRCDPGARLVSANIQSHGLGDRVSRYRPVTLARSEDAARGGAPARRMTLGK